MMRWNSFAFNIFKNQVWFEIKTKYSFYTKIVPRRIEKWIKYWYTISRFANFDFETFLIIDINLSCYLPYHFYTNTDKFYF